MVGAFPRPLFYWGDPNYTDMGGGWPNFCTFPAIDSIRINSFSSRPVSLHWLFSLYSGWKANPLYQLIDIYRCFRPSQGCFWRPIYGGFPCDLHSCNISNTTTTL